MADEAFYVRVRGKISGPFDIPTLQKLVRRGELSRIHEISRDRTAWSTAGEFEDLFPVGRVQSAPAILNESTASRQSASTDIDDSASIDDMTDLANAVPTVEPDDSNTLRERYVNYARGSAG